MKKITSLVFLSLISFFIYGQDYTVNEKIYGNDTVTWFGSDFSLFRLSNKKKVGEDEKLQSYIYGWNEYYKASVSNVKIASWISAKKVFNDKKFTDESYKNFLAKNWITEEKHTITKEDIQEHLKNYSSKHKGVGLVFIVECFHKTDLSMVSGYFVWFDIESKEVLQIFDVNGGATTFTYVKVILPKDDKMPKSKGMIVYWVNGMVDSTIKFANEYKDLNPFK